MIKHQKVLRLVAAFTLVCGAVARAEGDILTTLQGAATTAITAGIAMLGVVLLAAFGKDVGLKAYQWVRSALKKA